MTKQNFVAKELRKGTLMLKLHFSINFSNGLLLEPSSNSEF